MGLLYYFIKEAVRGFYQAKVMTAASIVSIAASLFFMSLVGIALINVQNLITNASSQADMAVYISDDLASNEEDLDEFVSEIRKMPQVDKINLISKDTAWDRFENLYGKEILESVDDNPLPASLEIFLKEQYQTDESANALQSSIKKLSGTESVRYSRELLNMIEKFQWYFSLIALIITAIMLIVLYFMVSNSIKLTIYARSELVRNMHLVGASRFFINIPFIIEGIIQGLTGALICTFALLVFKGSLHYLPVIWESEFFPMNRIVAAIFFTGVFFGWFGSISAVRKFIIR